MAKLIDILALELRVWPEGYARLEQSMMGVVFYKVFDGVLPVGIFTISDDYRTTKVTRAEWQAAVDALNAPKVVEWDGAGLPPVGKSSCEYLGAHQFDKWTVVNIFAHYGHTVFIDFGDGWRAETDSTRFRPILSAEQVAADEREKAIKDMMEVTSDGISCIGQDDALALYKAGYRKQ